METPPASSQRTFLHFHWLEMPFAIFWVGALSAYWIHIKMNVRFQSLLGSGLALDFPFSVIYVFVIYVTAIAAIVLVGLVAYLSIFGELRPRSFLRGAGIILFGVAFSNAAGLLLRDLPLPTTFSYFTTWSPLFFALWLSMWVSRPSGV
jgi:hypothetical protein